MQSQKPYPQLAPIRKHNISLMFFSQIVFVLWIGPILYCHHDGNRQKRLQLHDVLCTETLFA